MSSNINLEHVRFISKYFFFFFYKKKSQNSTSPTSSKTQKGAEPEPNPHERFFG